MRKKKIIKNKCKKLLMIIEIKKMIGNKKEMKEYQLSKKKIDN